MQCNLGKATLAQLALYPAYQVDALNASDSELAAATQFNMIVSHCMTLGHSKIISSAYNRQPVRIYFSKNTKVKAAT
jgi:hypothetical protein